MFMVPMRDSAIVVTTSNSVAVWGFIGARRLRRFIADAPGFIQPAESSEGEAA